MTWGLLILVAIAVLAICGSVGIRAPKAKLPVVLAVLCVAASSLVGCRDPRIGGPCRYAETPGKARITSVSGAPSGSYSCQNAVLVVFTFTADDPSAPARYRYPEWPDREQQFTVGAGMNPPRAWADLRGLVEGSEHRCSRLEMTAGACTPVLFVFSEVDLEGWEDGCW